MTIPTTKIVSLWFGDPPPWYEKFKARFDTNKLFTHCLIQFDSVQTFNNLVFDRTGYVCRKAIPYNTCDLRPLFGHLFDFTGYTYWGWCDLDIVVGNLDQLWGPLLSDYDILTTEPISISGPLTILRNTSDIVSLYNTTPDLHYILTEPDYCNFDEVGFNTNQQLQLKQLNPNANFTQLVLNTKLSIHYDDRVWTETHYTLSDGCPSRGCEILGSHLLETPTNRQLIMYHFNTKRWPIPDRSSRRRSERLHKWNEPKEIEPSTLLQPTPETIEFWTERAQDIITNERQLHYLSYYASDQQWKKIQSDTKDLLYKYIQPKQSVLDAGCGYGSLLPILYSLGGNSPYHGVDFCPDILEIAREQYKLLCKDHLGLSKQSITFTESDLRNLPFQNHTFDWAVCRGLEGSIRTYQGNKDWTQIRNQLLRVSKNVLLIEYDSSVRVLSQD